MLDVRSIALGRWSAVCSLVVQHATPQSRDCGTKAGRARGRSRHPFDSAQGRLCRKQLLNHFLKLRAEHVHLTPCVARLAGGNHRHKQGRGRARLCSQCRFSPSIVNLFA